MPETKNATTLPDVTDQSIDQLASMLGGGAEAVSAAKPPAPAAPAVQDPPVVADPAAEPKSEAAGVQTPPPEPGNTNEGEENTPAQQQEQQGQQQQEQHDGKGNKRKGSIDARLSALAQKRREAEARERAATLELEDTKARAERLQRELEALKSGQPGPGQQADSKPTTSSTTTRQQDGGAVFDKPKPSLKDFTQPGKPHYKEDEDYDDTIQRYQEAFSDWKDEQRQFETTQRAQQASVEEQRKTFLKDIEAAMDAHPEWEDARSFVIRNSTDEFQLALSRLPRFSPDKAAWTEMVVYLADNPDTLQDLSAQYSQNPVAAITELGRIMHSLNPGSAAAGRRTAAAPTTNEQGTTTTPTKPAYKPPAVVGGGAAPAPVDLETADLGTFAAAVKKYGIG